MLLRARDLPVLADNGVRVLGFLLALLRRSAVHRQGDVTHMDEVRDVCQRPARVDSLFTLVVKLE